MYCSDIHISSLVDLLSGDKFRVRFHCFVYGQNVTDTRGVKLVVTLCWRYLWRLVSHLRCLLRLFCCVGLGETEDDLEKRALIFEFPKQLRVLQANLDEFLAEIFAFVWWLKLAMS